MQTNEYLLIGVVACCIVPVIILFIAAFFIMRRAPKIIQPNVDDLRLTFNALKAKNANATIDELVRQVIQRQALRTGIIGAITSVGGLPVLPFGLTIDLLTTTRAQSAMLYFIAWAYQPTAVLAKQDVLDYAEALALRAGLSSNQLILLGGQRASSYALRRLFVIIVEKSFAKVIPGVGLFIGFVVNYTITRGMGVVAARWYADRFGFRPPPD